MTEDNSTDTPFGLRTPSRRSPPAPFARAIAETPGPEGLVMSHRSPAADFAEYFAQFQRRTPAVAHIDEKVQDAQKL
jgi:hypothetical protein